MHAAANDKDINPLFSITINENNKWIFLNVLPQDSEIDAALIQEASFYEKVVNVMQSVLTRGHHEEQLWRNVFTTIGKPEPRLLVSYSNFSYN